jgi:ATP-binding cassette subfamily G (WHITE) protein 2 (SNQ2)
MLEVIDAGATATSQIDWYNDVWMMSPEYKAFQNEIDRIHTTGAARPSVATEKPSEFSAPWMQQVTELLVRDLRAHWRDPMYLLAKLCLTVISGLYVGFTFWKAKDSIQGTQNKLLAIYTTLLLSYPLASQCLLPFLNIRSIYEIRERGSRMYSWTALLTSQILAEYPFNIAGFTIYFFCWYWTIGFPSSRAGYVYLVVGVIFPLFYVTLIQAIAALSSDPSVVLIFFNLMIIIIYIL